MQDIMRHIRSFLQFNIIKNIVVHKLNMEVLFLTVILSKFDGVFFKKWFGGGGWGRGNHFFCAMYALCHSRRGNFSKLTWNTLSSTFFNPPPPPLILDYCRGSKLVREAWNLALPSHLFTISLSRNSASLVMFPDCLISLNNLDYHSRVIHVPNFFWTKYHSKLRVKDDV